MSSQKLANLLVIILSVSFGSFLIVLNSSVQYYTLGLAILLVALLFLGMVVGGWKFDD